jgi:hypothetical protein
MASDTQAVRIARSISDEFDEAPALDLVAEIWAVDDAGRAEDIAQSITSEASKASTLAGIVQAAAVDDPDRAVRLTTEGRAATRLSRSRAAGLGCSGPGAAERPR